jgi:hypothetical protein
LNISYTSTISSTAVPSVAPVSFTPVASDSLGQPAIPVEVIVMILFYVEIFLSNIVIFFKCSQ